MRRTLLPLVLILGLLPALGAQTWGGGLSTLTQPHDYVAKRSSSYDPTGGNIDYRRIAPGATLVLLDAAGPAEVRHIWMTLHSDDRWHLKTLVLRMYWDNEASPSVEAPLGDFFGLGLGEYVTYQSAVLAVAPDRALNCFFPMPFRRHARITITNEGQKPVKVISYSVDYRQFSHPLPPGTLYFHAEYRQAAPNRAIHGAHVNLDGKNNYVWMEARGRGHFVGVTMSVIENQDKWWGEGDDMFFVDGATRPSLQGTGSEDFFLSSWDFGRSFAYSLFGAPVVAPNHLKGSRWSMYRFMLANPIPFTRSLRATIEHGSANDRADSFYSVAYWYQTEPHAPFPPLPPVSERIPRTVP
ncbi:MAG: glycoside hydrolase family 172 protein [Opitutaceae bacterium]